MVIQNNIIEDVLVSIVVPCYMQGEYLTDALHSIQEQTYQTWECLIIDDGSTDITQEVALEFCMKDHRFKYHFQYNGGLSSARNYGISVALGTYILPLDADDKIGSGYLQNAVKFFINDNSIVLIYCHAELFGDINREWKLPEFSYRNLLMNNMIFCSAIFKKNDFQNCGGYDISFKNGWEDWDLWIRMLQNGGKVIKLSETYFYYRKKANSMIDNLMDDHSIQKKILQKLYFKYLHIYSDFFSEPITAFHKNETLLMDLVNNNENYEKKIIAIYNSASYRLGYAVLQPIRKIKFIIKSLWK